MYLCRETVASGIHFTIAYTGGVADMGMGENGKSRIRRFMNSRQEKRIKADKPWVPYEIPRSLFTVCYTASQRLFTRNEEQNDLGIDRIDLLTSPPLRVNGSNWCLVFENSILVG